MKNKFNTYFMLVLTSLLFVQISYSQTPTDKNMALGNPSNAKTDTTLSDNYLIVKPQYTLSYNNLTHIPNWVSWHVNSMDLGTEDRQNDFRADTTLPASWYQVSPADYKNTGFDKGHQCPSGDRTSSISDNSATFLMTNMIPQAPKNNEVTWKNLEDYSRSLVAQGNELYIICGVYGQVGTGKKGAASNIGHGVVVPAKTWKIIVVLSEKTRVTTTTRVIAVLMPNTQDCSKQPWSSYRVSVNSLEKLTKYDFLSNVPENIQKVIEARVDTVSIKGGK